MNEKILKTEDRQIRDPRVKTWRNFTVYHPKKEFTMEEEVNLNRVGAGGLQSACSGAVGGSAGDHWSSL